MDTRTQYVVTYFVCFSLLFCVTFFPLLFSPNGWLHDIKYNGDIQSGSCDVSVISNVTLADHVYTMGAIFVWQRTNHSDLVELQCDASDLRCFQNLIDIAKTKTSSCYLHGDGHLAIHKDKLSYTWDIALMIAAAICFCLAAGTLCIWISYRYRRRASARMRQEMQRKRESDGEFFNRL